MKKICLALVLMMVIPFVVSAEEGYHKGVATTTVYQEGTYFADNDVMYLATDYSKEINQLVEGIKEMEKIIYISNPVARCSEYEEIMRRVINENPEFFYVDSSYYYHYSGVEENPVVIAIEPIYNMGKEDAEERLKLMKKETQHIIDTCITESMSDYDKLLQVHDYFCVNYEYDTTGERRSAAHILVDKTGVCEAYSLAYKYVMSILGINCDYASSEQMNHMWNMVECGGDWFHVDVTWDDPTPNIKGRARHKYFMVDDKTFEEEGHYNWSTDHLAGNRTYSDSSSRNIDSAIYYRNNKYYHIDEYGNLCCSTGICKGNCEKKYQSESKFYIADMQGYYFTKMSYIVEGNSCFYFTEADGIYKFNYTDENAVPVRVYTSKNGTYPVELILNDDKLSFKTAVPYSNGTMVVGRYLTYSVKYDDYLGNFNGDDSVSMADAIIVASAALGDNNISEKSRYLADVTQDGKITISDAIWIAENVVGARSF